MKKSVCSVLAFLMLLSAMGFSGCGSGNGTWTSTGGSLSKYPITSLAYDGAHNVLYAGTRQGKGGVWKYDGTKWVSINKGIAGYGIYSLVYDSKHNMLYAGCWNDSTYSGGVWGYNGSTWINTGEGMSNNQVQSLAYDPTHNLLYAGCIGLAGPEHPETGSGLWKYDGTTWTFISGEGSKGGVTCLTYDSVHNFLYVNGSWKYDGTTWVFLGGGLLVGANASEYDPTHNVLYTATSGNGIGKYDGKSWTNIGKDVSSYTIESLAYDSAHNILYAGDGGVWKYDGKSWTNTGGEVSSSSLAYDSVHNILYAGCFEISFSNNRYMTKGKGVWFHSVKP